MNPDLLQLITEYQARVAWAVAQIEQTFGVERPRSAIEWTGYDIPHGEAVDGVRYHQHGYGIAVHWGDGAIDFDFGEAGEIDGFCASRLFSFSRYTPSGSGFASEAQVQSAMEEELAHGSIRFSGSINYYLQDPP